jgi:hypothetical protein
MPDAKAINEVMDCELSHVIHARAQQQVVHQIVGEAEFVYAVVKFDGSVGASGRCLHAAPSKKRCWIVVLLPRAVSP